MTMFEANDELARWVVGEVSEVSSETLVCAHVALSNYVARCEQESEMLECESESCVFCNRGVCRFNAVYGREPTITEQDGCVDSCFYDPSYC